MPERKQLTPEERRSRKAQRREKQRALNPLRAQKMHAARLAFEADHPPLFAHAPSELPRLNVGCSGWFYWHWREAFYPRDTPTNKWFAHYAKQFGTVELNAPFYAWPTVAAVRAWVKQAQDQPFVYTVKVSELITHIKHFSRTRELVRDFGHIADMLGPQMGCFLFQLPPSFHYSPARLARICDQLNPSRRNVVEFRHKSWWNDRVYKAFERADIIFCACSGPRLPDELVKTADEIYVRFHGIKQWYRHDYSEEELAVWTGRIVASGAKRAWIYFNNDRDCHAIHNARELRRQLTEAGFGS